MELTKNRYYEIVFVVSQRIAAERGSTMKFWIQEQFGVDGGVAFLYFLGMLIAIALLVAILALIGRAFCKICGSYTVPILICAVGVCVLFVSWVINIGVVLAVIQMIFGLIFLSLGICLIQIEYTKNTKQPSSSTHFCGFRFLD